MRAASGQPPIHCYGLTTPLVTKSDGGKFGKTESGTIWLSAERTSPYQFYQYLLQTADADVGTWLRYFSFKPLEEIARLEASLKAHPEKREAQLALARELTELVHGAAELAKIEQATQALFGGGDLQAMSLEELQKAFAEAPASTLPRARLSEGEGVLLVDLLAETGLCASKGMARKDIQGGGISLNQARIADVQRKVGPQDLLHGTMLVLRKGKKTYHLVSIV
jgi:tyrosyl-tRNA synthetase